MNLEPAASPAALADLEAQEKQLHEEWQQVHQHATTLLAERDKNLRKRKALEHAVATRGPEEVEKPGPAKRKCSQPINEQVQALVLKKEELSWAEAAKMFDISLSSVRRIVGAAHEEERRTKALALGTPAPPAQTTKKKGRKPGWSWRTLWLEDQPTLTLKHICAQVRTKLGKTICKSTVDRALSALDISYKETTLIPARWNEEHVILAWQRYVRDEEGRPLVFIDKCAFNLHLTGRKGRAVKGAPACLTVLPKQKNLTLTGALARSGMIFHKFVTSTSGKRGVDADDFRLFLLDLRPHLPESAVILLDNAAIHKTDAVEKTFDLLRADGFEVLFLPPYSPFLNAIEYAFAKIKHLVRQATFHNRSELRDAIVDALPSVSSTDAQHWFLHMVQFYNQCALGLPFTGKPLAPTLLDTPAPPVQLHQWQAAVSVEASPPRICAT